MLLGNTHTQTHTQTHTSVKTPDARQFDKSGVQPAAVAAIAVRDGLHSQCQVVEVVDVGPALEEQLDHVNVAPAGRHGQDAGAKPVAAVYLRPILQEEVGDSQVAKPSQKTETTDKLVTDGFNLRDFIKTEDITLSEGVCMRLIRHKHEGFFINVIKCHSINNNTFN